jgi:predicted RNA-binding protein YlqC (UPF0109 family)
MSEPSGDLRLLLENIAKSLVDTPDEVIVEQIEEERETVLELEVAESDVGKVIGRQGRTVRALRTLLGAAGMKQNRRFAVEVLE